jgi:hypothetical protein
VYSRFPLKLPEAGRADQSHVTNSCRYGHLTCDGRIMSPKARKAAFVKVLVQLGPFDRRPMRFDNPAHIARLAEKLTRQMDSGVS